MLTGDLNVATVEWIVQYKISDPYKYLFKLRDVEQTFRLMSEASMRTVVGDHSVTELLTVGREAIAAKAKELLSELCRLLRQRHLRAAAGAAGRGPARAGEAVVQRGQPGDPGARARHQRGVGRVQPGDPAGARARRAEDPGAEGYAVDRVNRAKGDAQRFIALEEQYRKAPEVTRTRIYLETLSAVLPGRGQEADLRREGQGDPAPVPARRDARGARPEEASREVARRG